MPAHATLPDLSSYLDGELAPERHASLASHLERCAGCRDRLDGLRRAVRQLERLEAEAPPAHLGEVVRHRVAAHASRRGVLERGQRWLDRLAGLQVLGPALAVVVALAIILYLFALEAARREAGPGGSTVVVLEPVGGPHAGEAAPGEAEGRRFRHRDGVWVEAGLESATPARTVSLADRELAPELAAELERLARIGPRVRFRYRGEVLELVPSPVR